MKSQQEEQDQPFWESIREAEVYILQVGTLVSPDAPTTFSFPRVTSTFSFPRIEKNLSFDDLYPSKITKTPWIWATLKYNLLKSKKK
jgi:hypothetical protein